MRAEQESGNDGLSLSPLKQLAYLVTDKAMRLSRSGAQHCCVHSGLLGSLAVQLRHVCAHGDAHTHLMGSPPSGCREIRSLFQSLTLVNSCLLRPHIKFYEMHRKQGVWAHHITTEIQQCAYKLRTNGS